MLNFPQHLPTHFLEDVRRDDERRLEQQQEDEEQEVQDQIIDAMLLNKHTEIETEIESQPTAPTPITISDAPTATSVSSATKSSFVAPTIALVTSHATPLESTAAKPITDISADSVGAGDVIVVSKTDIPANVLSANADSREDDDDDEDDDVEDDTDTEHIDAVNSPQSQQQQSGSSPATPVAHQHRQSAPSDKLRIITVHPIVVDQQQEHLNATQSPPSPPPMTASLPKRIVLANDDDATIKRSSTAQRDAPHINQSAERGYYEKTIFNKNGVFIENIRKIANIDDDADEEPSDTANKVILNTSSAASGHGSSGSSDNDSDSDDSAEIAAAAAATMKKMALLRSAPLSQHYVITSSGRIEKSDAALASDDVIVQFREGLNEYQRPEQSYRQVKVGDDEDEGSQSSAAASHNWLGGVGSYGMLPRADVSVTTDVLAATTVTAVAQNQQPLMEASAQPAAHCIVMGK